MAERDHGPGRPMPQPAEGLPFDDALTGTMRDHRGALSALEDDPEFERHMAAARRVMQKHRGVLVALAESERRDREADLAAVESTALGETLDDLAG